MKRILLKIVLFLSLVTTPIVALHTIPYSEEFAYHYIENDCYNHGAWIFDRITHNTVPIDIAFIGSSHTIHAYQEAKIEGLLGSGYHLANLGYCRYGRNLEYSLLKLLLKHKNPKVIILEVHEDEEKNSHDIFPYLASTKDLISSPISRDYFSDLLNGTSARLEFFKAKYIFTPNYQTPNTEHYGYGASDRIAPNDELIENKKVWTKRMRNNTGKTFDELQLRYPKIYLEKMIELIRAKNILLLFVYLPEYGSKLTSPKYAKFYLNTAPLLIPPGQIFENTKNWMDACHLNDNGSAVLSSWMAEQLKEQLCINPNIHQNCVK